MARSKLLDFNRIREAVSFQTVLDHYGFTVPNNGRTQVKINCPFHDDDTPSLSINLEKGIYNCFGCPAEGNVLDFIAGMEGFEQNPTYNAAKFGLELIGADPNEFRKEPNGPETPQKPRRRATDKKTAPTPSNDPKTPQRAKSAPSEEEKPVPTENPVIDLSLKLDPAHPFLTDRGVSEDLAKAFGMGFCTRGMMRNRIAIPIHNSTGELVAYTGRWADDYKPDKEPKYKLPKDFHKSLELYNFHRASALNKRFVVVVEGIWSVLRLHAAGIPAVALLGTSCSEIQATTIASAWRYVVVILDGDDAGEAARPNVVDTLSKHVYVKALVLPDGNKPDTMDETIIDKFRV